MVQGWSLHPSREEQYYSSHFMLSNWFEIQVKLSTTTFTCLKCLDRRYLQGYTMKSLVKIIQQQERKMVFTFISDQSH